MGLKDIGKQISALALILLAWANTSQVEEVVSFDPDSEYEDFPVQCDGRRHKVPPGEETWY